MKGSAKGDAPAPVGSVKGTLPRPHSVSAGSSERPAGTAKGHHKSDQPPTPTAPKAATGAKALIVPTQASDVVDPTRARLAELLSALDEPAHPPTPSHSPPTPETPPSPPPQSVRSSFSSLHIPAAEETAPMGGSTSASLHEKQEQPPEVEVLETSLESPPVATPVETSAAAAATAVLSSSDEIPDSDAHSLGGLSAGLRSGNIPTPIRPVKPSKGVSKLYGDAWQGQVDDTQARGTVREGKGSPETAVKHVAERASAEKRHTKEKEKEALQKRSHRLPSVSSSDSSSSSSSAPPPPFKPEADALHKMKQDVLHARRQADDSTKRLFDSERECAKLRARLRQQENDTVDSLSRAEVSQQDTAHLRKEVARLRDGMQGGWTEHEAMKRQVAHSLARSRDLEMQLISSQTRIDKLSEDNEALREQDAVAQRELGSLQCSAQQAKDRVAVLEEEVVQQEFILAATKEAAGIAQESLADVQKATGAEIMALHTEVAGLRQQLAEAEVGPQETVEALHSELCILRERDVARCREDDLRLKLESVQEENRRLREQTAVADSSAAEIAHLREQIRCEREQHNETNADLKSAKRHLQAEVLALRGRLEVTELEKEKTQESYWNKLYGRCEEIIDNAGTLRESDGMASSASDVSSKSSSERSVLTYEQRPVSYHDTQELSRPHLTAGPSNAPMFTPPGDTSAPHSRDHELAGGFTHMSPSGHPFQRTPVLIGPGRYVQPIIFCNTHPEP